MISSALALAHHKTFPTVKDQFHFAAHAAFPSFFAMVRSSVSKPPPEVKYPLSEPLAGPFGSGDRPPEKRSGFQGFPWFFRQVATIILNSPPKVKPPLSRPPQAPGKKPAFPSCNQAFRRFAAKKSISAFGVRAVANPRSLITIVASFSSTESNYARLVLACQKKRTKQQILKLPVISS